MTDREPIIPAPLGPLIWDPADPGYNLPQYAHLQTLAARRECMPQVHALLRAGWRFELPEGDPEPSAWYWRRLPRRKGSKGMFFASTNQAYQAMMREGNAP